MEVNTVLFRHCCQPCEGKVRYFPLTSTRFIAQGDGQREGEKGEQHRSFELTLTHTHSHLLTRNGGIVRFLLCYLGKGDCAFSSFFFSKKRGMGRSETDKGDNDVDKKNEGK